MEERVPIVQPAAEPKPVGGVSHGWLAFWLIVFLVLGFG